MSLRVSGNVWPKIKTRRSTGNCGKTRGKLAQPTSLPPNSSLAGSPITFPIPAAAENIQILINVQYISFIWKNKIPSQTLSKRMLVQVWLLPILQRFGFGGGLGPKNPPQSKESFELWKKQALEPFSFGPSFFKNFSFALLSYLLLSTTVPVPLLPWILLSPLLLTPSINNSPPLMYILTTHPPPLRRRKTLSGANILPHGQALKESVPRLTAPAESPALAQQSCLFFATKANRSSYFLGWPEFWPFPTLPNRRCVYIPGREMFQKMFRKNNNPTN